ncbi:MAG: poly-gamma-glutamate biosynthesis protein PgsC [Desulfatiglans sp.]|jgi:poly-gamma-glutamate biosynthesis protein PgsC/CapC|nr:poly-gamma-glutamate biosynthesis protein PgsC [Thermodesulfobacteriota bacterium]MEE4351790.1 poly-gamma-glutamate biosynthesis protein PgsC [Desulfatiglans sp.]
MGELLTLSIGTGLVVSLAFSEMLGLTAGGMVIPGYVALYLNQPLVVAFTLLMSYLTYFVVHSASSIMIIYGRRRTVLMILVGYVLGTLLRFFGSFETPATTIDLSVIGYIIPGLIAIWIDRQGVIESFSALIIASIIVRFILILFTGGEINL